MQENQREAFDSKVKALKRDFEIDPEYYTAWEIKFVRDLVSRAGWFGHLTPAQEKAFNEVWRKHLKR